jgi:hypothetical protein
MKAIVKDVEKIQKITELHSQRDTLSCRLILELLDTYLAEARLLNDIISPSDLPWNQGKIDAWLALKKHIEVGVEMPELKHLPNLPTFS